MAILVFIWPAILAGKDHWAFRPVVRPELPAAAERDPVAWFVTERLKNEKLSLAAPASRRAWIRRLFYNLTGLPPDHETLGKWLAVTGEDRAVAERLTDELLASPHYGEHWARHWLDVARYSDTKGYAYAGEEFSFPHAWVYRDWVVDAFNEDMPYDKFVQRQLAADLLLEENLCDREDLSAMGFLTLGRRFLGVEPEIIDDRIDVVTRGFLGLTVSCARCHEHKFDPIPIEDYYALYGVFKSSREDLQALDPEVARQHVELEKKKTALAADFDKRATEVEGRFLKRTAEYMVAALDISIVPPPDFAEIIEKEDLNPAQIRRWYEFLSQEALEQDSVFGPWIARAHARVSNLNGVNPLVAEAVQEPVEDMMDLAKRYAALFQRSVGEEKENDTPAWRALRAVVVGPGSPIRIPREYIHDVEWLFDDGNKGPLKKQQAEVERAVIGLQEKAPHSLVLVDRAVPVNVRVFERGQYPNQLEEVPRGTLGILGAGDRARYGKGSGRLDLAREITSRSNPLTARVIANRVWRAHFGEGLVRTESDFGLRSEEPSHPRLLDYLASELVNHEWSLKHLQRLITTSAIYRLRTGEPPAADAENRLLSVYPRRRLDFEAMRDSMLAASGELDLRRGGPPAELLGAAASPRRSLYGRIDRQYLPSTLRVFDFANPELHSPRRYRTNVPQQALFLMNAPFTVARARALAARVVDELPQGDDASRVARMFQHVYGRLPNGRELAGSVHFVTPAPVSPEEREREIVASAWSYGYGRMDEESGRVAEFHQLPHSSREAWGGGANWPDASLGWVRLTAAGGHAGNKVEHAAIRRWTSPVKGRLHLRGAIRKVEECGDGLRGWVSSDRQGVLGAWHIGFGNPQPAEIDAIEVQAGECLDFVIDCGAANNFSCDGFEWAPRLELVGSDRRWDAREDFAGADTLGETLNAWERLAQALLISNEAMFMD